MTPSFSSGCHSLPGHPRQELGRYCSLCLCVCVGFCLFVYFYYLYIISPQRSARPVSCRRMIHPEVASSFSPTILSLGWWNYHVPVLQARSLRPILDLHCSLCPNLSYPLFGEIQAPKPSCPDHCQTSWWCSLHAACPPQGHPPH